VEVAEVEVQPQLIRVRLEDHLISLHPVVEEVAVLMRQRRALHNLVVQVV
jgi:hypothetical protein